MSDVVALEGASYATWTADVSDVLEHWHVTATAGFTRRINSARATGEATAGARTRRRLSEWFHRRDLPLVIRETPLMARETSEAIRAQWDFEPLDETRVLTNTTRSSEIRVVQMVSVADRRFQSDLAILNAHSGADAAALGRICTRVADRAVGIWVPGRCVGVVVKAGGHAAVFSVAVAPDSRQSGLATRVVAAASSWAADEGIEELFVQVLGTNRPAAELYEGLGFVERYRYRYLQAHPDCGSA